MAEELFEQDGSDLQALASSFRAGDVVISSEPWVWSFKYKEHKLFCAECFRESQSLRVCSNCKLYRYCDKACQSVNWKKEHKYECEMLEKCYTKHSEIYHESNERLEFDTRGSTLQRPISLLPPKFRDSVERFDSTGGTGLQVCYRYSTSDDADDQTLAKRPALVRFSKHTGMAKELTEQDGCGLPALAPSFRAGDVVISSEPWVWSFKYEQHKVFCAECYRESQGLRVCSNCKLYRYCDKECQAANWKKEHKYECVMLKKTNTKYNEKSRQSDVNPNERYLETALVDNFVAEILIAKAIGKLQRGERYELSTSSVSLSAAEVLQLLPYDPAFEEDFKSTVISNLVWDTADLKDIPNFDGLLRKIFYNAFPIADQQGKMEMIAAGIFIEALYREMTPVCWDTNVTMDLQGRTLVVRATQDIPNYTGLKDLRQNELVGNNFVVPLSQRRKTFESLYLHPCACSKGAPKYDAESNPLKCSTSGCTERIPSDIRALRPCVQCGAINDNRLHMFTELKYKYDTIATSAVPDGVHRIEQLTSLFWEVHQADILQPDAHFRLACGYGVLLSEEKRFEDTWNACCDMIACIRAIYPKYHLTRAQWLGAGASSAVMWIVHIRAHEEENSREKIRKLYSEGMEWSEEARNIYGMISGKGSKWEQQVATVLRRFEDFRISLMLDD